MHSDLYDPRRAARPGAKRGWDPTLRKEWSETEDWFFRGFPAYFVTGLLLFLLACFASLGAVPFPGGMETGLLAYTLTLVAALSLFALLPAWAAYAAARRGPLAVRRALIVVVPGTAFALIAGLLPLAGLSPFAWGRNLVGWDGVAVALIAGLGLSALLSIATVGLRVQWDRRRARALGPTLLRRGAPPPPAVRRL